MKVEQKQQFEQAIQNMRLFWNQSPMIQYSLDIYWENLKKFSANQFRIASESLLRTFKPRWKDDFPTPLEFEESVPNDPKLV